MIPQTGTIWKHKERKHAPICKVIYADFIKVQVNNDISFKGISPKNGSRAFDEYDLSYFRQNFKRIENEEIE